MKASKLQTALSRHVNILRTIKGYLGLAILNPTGNVLATDVAGESVRIEDFSKELNNLFANCSKTVNQKGLDRCTSFTIHTSKAIIMMMSADVYKQGNFRFVGIMAPEETGFSCRPSFSGSSPRCWRKQALSETCLKGTDSLIRKPAAALMRPKWISSCN